MHNFHVGRSPWFVMDFLECNIYLCNWWIRNGDSAKFLLRVFWDKKYGPQTFDSLKNAFWGEVLELPIEAKYKVWKLGVLWSSIYKYRYDDEKLKVIREPGFFNMSSSFRFDSTFPTPYLDFQPLIKERKVNINTVMEKKTKLILWIVSHCETMSNREGYVAQLQKHVKVYYENSSSRKETTTGFSSFIITVLLL